MHIWALYESQQEHPNPQPPFANHKDLYSTIDAIELGDIPWQSFTISYSGDLPEGDQAPPWMTAEYEIWFRDPERMLSQQISDPSVAGEIDYAPKRLFGLDGERQYIDLMSGDWSWRQAVHYLLCMPF